MNLVMKTLTETVGKSIYKFNYAGKSSLLKSKITQQKINPESLKLSSPKFCDTLEIKARKDFKALLDYKNDDLYEIINEVASNGTQNFRVENLRQVISKNILSADKNVYRGEGFEALSNSVPKELILRMKRAILAAKTGKLVQSDINDITKELSKYKINRGGRFISTTTKANEAGHFSTGVLWDFNVKKGTKAIDLDKALHCSSKTAENEILLNSGTMNTINDAKLENTSGNNWQWHIFGDITN